MESVWNKELYVGSDVPGEGAGASRRPFSGVGNLGVVLPLM